MDDIEKNHIGICLDEVTQILYECLCQENQLAKTIAKHKNIIVDVNCLKTALTDWYEYKDWDCTKKQAANNAKTQSFRARKDYGLPTGVIKSIKDFSKASQKGYK